MVSENWVKIMIATINHLLPIIIKNLLPVLSRCFGVTTIFHVLFVVAKKQSFQTS